jgi:hypothetical protein
MLICVFFTSLPFKLTNTEALQTSELGTTLVNYDKVENIILENIIG